ncbi:MAG: 3'-5' exonuclease [Neisseria sp.]|nr:3'-5' exonuclease [Neisseria sp.]
MFSLEPSTALLQDLNPQQLTAVTWPEHSALVLAGAGSGKTRVLTARIAWLLQTGLCPAQGILAVTFTNKAAREMQSRLNTLLDTDTRAMWLGTFHGLCHRFLRLHHRDAGLAQSFQIIDTADQLSLIKHLLRNLNINEETLPPRQLQGFINAQKESGLRAGMLSGSDPLTRLMIECYAEYDKACLRDGAVDFAELMLRSYEVLSSNEALRLHYQKRFRHILVDEFQDTNKLQYAWLKLLAGGGAAVFAVGDDDQSIYRFRGADVGNMDALIKDFGVAEPIRLEQNYRSDGNILSAANAVIAHNKKRLGKNLHTDAEAGDKICFFAAGNDLEEASFIASEIRALQKDGQSLKQTAILYRNNAQSRTIEQILFRNKIPYKIYGGLRFYERQEIKDTLAYLRLAVNPDDDGALLRVINVPPRGMGPHTIETIRAAANEGGVSLWQGIPLSGIKASKTEAFIQLIESFRNQIGQLGLAEIVANIIRDSGLRDFYGKQKDNAADRLENLDELVNAASSFIPEEGLFAALPAKERRDPAFPVLAFLSNASLESGEMSAAKGDDAVQLMTVHAAKGLEFDTVFLSGLEEGRFPSQLSLNEVGGLEEERRLMYVAITRARRRLCLSMAEERMLHGRMQPGISSRFISEIPSELLYVLSPRKRKPYPAPLFYGKPMKKLNDVHEYTPPRDYHGWRIGQNVRHGKFGTGVIIDAADKGASARLTINFGKQGVKELDTAFAKLEAV